MSARLHWSFLLVFAACGTRGELYTQALTPLPLVATSSAVVQVVPQTRRAVLLTPGELTPRAVTLSLGARWAARVPGSELVTVLGGTPKAPKLDLLDVETGEVLTLEAPGFFDAVSFSPDGSFGVLTYLAGNGTGQLTARNLNEVGLLDVGAKSVQRLQLDTESLAPRAVLFGPKETGRQLVAVTLEHGVALFDALHPEVAPRRISIRPQGSSAESSVEKAVFSRDARWLFLRASNLDDVIAVELGAEVGQPVSASINFISGGRGLTDIAAPPPGFEDSVLAVYVASEELFLLDARGIQDHGRRLPLTAPLTTLAPLSGSRVLLFATGSQVVTAWDVADGRSGTATLDGVYGVPMVVSSLDKALFPHANLSSAAGNGPALSSVTVADDTNRLRLRIQGVQLSRPLAAAALDESTDRLFFSVSGGTSVVTMELQTLQLAEVRLDLPAVGLSYLSRGDWLVADHRTAFGDVTTVPAGTTERAGAIRYSDFAFTGDLDRPGDAL